MGAGLEGLERGLEGGHFGAGGDDLGGELGELGVEVGAELFDGLLEAVVGCDLLGLADLDGFDVGEDGGAEQVGEGIDGVVHEEILRGVGIGRRITGERALVMGAIEAGHNEKKDNNSRLARMRALASQQVSLEFNRRPDSRKRGRLLE